MTRLTFSLPMVRAFRAGLKTQTRRTSPPRFKVGDVVAIAEPCAIAYDGERNRLLCRYEADRYGGGGVRSHDDPAVIARCATMPTVINHTPRSARFMPGWAERSKVKITEIRQEALGDTADADAVREGFTDRAAFLAYFGTLHKGPIDLTLPVWVISFEVVT